MDTLTNLRTFLQVAQAGSFAAAARRIGIAVSVVKKRVDQLEHQVGSALLVRSTRRMVLTEAGTLHLARFERAVQGMDEALAAPGQKPAHIDGHLRIKVPTTLNMLYLGPMLVRFQLAHPGVSLEIIAIDRPVNPQLEGFDLAVGVTPGSFGGVVDVGLCATQRVVVAAPRYLAERGTPHLPRELLTHDILNFQPTGDSWTFNGPNGPLVVRLQPRLACNDGQQLLRAALAGLGITSLSAYIVNPSIQQGALVPLLKNFPMPEYWIHLQIPEPSLHLGRVQALRDFLKKQFTPHAPWEAPGPEYKAI